MFRYVKLSFLTTSDLQKVRKELWSAVRRNKERMKARYCLKSNYTK